MIRQLCAEAADYGFAAVCVPPCYVKIAAGALADSSINIATVVGFPCGYQTAEVKFFEAHKALSAGAREIDVVINLAAFKSGKLDEVENEMGELATLCHLRGAILKVIIETALLTPDEIILMCELCAQAEVDFVKTSTGFSSRGVSVADVQLMREHLPDTIRIKASGGIRDAAFAKELILVDFGKTFLPETFLCQIEASLRCWRQIVMKFFFEAENRSSLSDRQNTRLV